MKKRKIELNRKLFLGKETVTRLNVVGGYKQTDPEHGCHAQTNTYCVDSMCPDNCVGHISMPGTLCCGFGKTAIIPCQPKTVMVGGTCACTQ